MRKLKFRQVAMNLFLKNNYFKMENHTQVQENIYKNKINFVKENYFGNRISKYLVKRFYNNYLKLPLLDAGAGDGSFIKTLRLKNNIAVDKIFGVDLVEVPELNIVKGDLGKLSFKNNFFTTIICTEVLEHLDDETLAKAFKEFQRILKERGHLIATFPFKEDLERNSFICPSCNKKFHKYGHARAFCSKEEIQKIFNRNGFSITFIDILPLGAIATFPPLVFLKFFLNMLDNPPGLRKRAIVIAKRM